MIRWSLTSWMSFKHPRWVNNVLRYSTPTRYCINQWARSGHQLLHTAEVGRRRGPPPQGTLADGCSGSETPTPKKARRLERRQDTKWIGFGMLVVQRRRPRAKRGDSLEDRFGFILAEKVRIYFVSHLLIPGGVTERCTFLCIIK